MIRVLLADDDPLVRVGLTMMLRGAEGMEVIGEVGTGPVWLTPSGATPPTSC